ncbi:MAG TPA: Mur ligase domain-containing protein, partial [Methylovirgula sp.]
MRSELSQNQGWPEPLWTNLGLISILQARVSGKVPQSCTGISIDTRSLFAGDLFFAVKGVNSDGHDYVAHAFGSGAVAAVV